jgi:predicted dinucleotide-binding enzyme
MANRIAVLGTGDVGQVLGSAFVTVGHDVTMGSRDAKNEKAQAWAKKNGAKAKVATFADAVKASEIVVLSTAWTGTKSAIDMAGPENFAGKVVIDTTNPLAIAPGAPPSLAIGHTDSAGESVQRWLPKARVVKAFNIVGNAHMFKPAFAGGPPTMFFCGNDAEAKKTVAGILESFGWESMDIGGIEGSRLLEPMCILWVGIGIKTGAWNHAFKLLRK